MTEATTAARELSPGTVLDGMYTTGVAIASRPGAVTYEAIGPSEEPLAVTIYESRCFADANAREQSLRAIRKLEGVDEGGVVEILDSGKLEDGGVYEIHERVIGTPLSQISTLPASKVFVVDSFEIMLAFESAHSAKPLSAPK